MKWCVIAVACLTWSCCRGDVVLPSVVSDGMVLQRESEVRLWGWATRGEDVSVQGSWMASPVRAKPDGRGRWQVSVATGEAGGPYTVTVAGETTVTVRDVYIGEVWVCSGQSNMEWTLAMTGDAESIASANDDRLRVFTVGKQMSLHSRFDATGAWRAATPGHAPGMSAAAYHFGTKLRAELGVPIGLIVTAWGGTRIEAWMPASSLGAFVEYESELSILGVASGDPSGRVEMTAALERRWWESLDDAGVRGWTGADFDASAWGTMELPASMGPDGLDTFDGVVYFRREVEVPASMAGDALELHLGPIDDYDDVWLNGVHVGATHAENQWSVPRVYAVPVGVVDAGRNVVAVRVLDTAGTGGINGKPEQMMLVGGGERVWLAGEWRVRRGKAVSEIRLGSRGALEVNANTATVLYSGMIEPIADMSVRGMLWYQGESNRHNAHRYADLMEAMIGAWRVRFGGGELPFYYVQIAPFNYGGDTGQTGMLREAQRLAMRVPNTGMVVTSDIGDVRDIHPKNKKDVGERLARWALARTYGHDVVYSGPLVAGAVREGSKVRVTFDHAAGLIARGGAVRHVQVASVDGVFHAAEATIEGETLVVWSERASEPRRVRLGWGATDELNLFNEAGLPASPFEVEVE